MRTPNPATLHLHMAGVTVTELAERLGVTPQAISLQLAGRTARTNPALLEAIAELISPDVAARVESAVDGARRRHQRSEATR